MATELTFDAIRLPPECQALRQEVRAFLAKEIEAGTFSADPGGIDGTYSEEFSRKVGARGWIGMTWPKKYGGQEKSFLERYVVTEEFRVANAPVRLHFVADRQSGPVLLKYGSERIKADVLPRICKGEVCFAIGMSEPNSGSDLFAAKTQATKTEGGWLVNGTKIWTSNAHQAHYLIALFRTSPPTKENRRHGLTQFLVDMRTPGITVNPIYQMTGVHDFNEVVFQDAFMPDDHVLGEVDGAWKQATSELAYERSGPGALPGDLLRSDGAGPRARRQARYARRRGPGPAGGAGACAAAHVGVGGRHAARRQGAGGGGGHRQGRRHHLGAEAAPQGPRSRRLRRGRLGQPGELRGAAAVRHPDRAQAHHPGRHHGDPARHHRPRAGAAMKFSALASCVPSPLGEKVPEGPDEGAFDACNRREVAPHQFGQMTYARAIYGRRMRATWSPRP